MQDHRVRDVSDVKLVEANELVALGNAGAQHIQGVHRALQRHQFAMHLAHEFVKVQAHLALDGHRIEKAVHQKTFSAPHPAVHVNALRDVGPVQQLLEGIRPFGLVRCPIVGTALQSVDRTQLRRVTLKAFGGQLGQVRLFDAHGVDASEKANPRSGARVSY